MAKDKKENKDAENEKKAAPEQEVDEDFKYLVRIADTDIDGNHPVRIGMTKIKGVGDRIATLVAQRAGVDKTEKIGNLSDEDIAKLQKTLEEIQEKTPAWLLNRRRDYDTGDDIHLIGPTLNLTMRDDINRLKKMRSYRGIRHEQGHKVRGQRTRSNGRTGLTLGVSRKRD